MIARHWAIMFECRIVWVVNSELFLLYHSSCVETGQLFGAQLLVDDAVSSFCLLPQVFHR